MQCRSKRGNASFARTATCPARGGARNAKGIGQNVYDRNKEDKKTLDKITAVRSVYPQRISEAEPRDASANYY
jgi:hypothetical protein